MARRGRLGVRKRPASDEKTAQPLLGRLSLYKSVGPLKHAMLILPGGAAWDSGNDIAAVEVASIFLYSGVLVAAMCGATVAR